MSLSSLILGLLPALAAKVEQAREDRARERVKALEAELADAREEAAYWRRERDRAVEKLSLAVSDARAALADAERWRAAALRAAGGGLIQPDQQARAAALQALWAQAQAQALAQAALANPLLQRGCTCVPARHDAFLGALGG